MVSAVDAKKVAGPPRAALVWLALSLVYLIWGSTYLAIRITIETIPPLLSASVRFLIAGLLMGAVAVRRGYHREERVGRAQWRAAFIVGGALLLGGNGLVVLSELRIASSVAALIIALVPIWMVALARILYREHLSFAIVAGVATGFAGVALLIWPFGAGRIDLLGGLGCAGAGLLWAWGSLYSRTASLPHRPQLSTAMQMLAGGVLLAFVGAATGEVGRIGFAEVSARSAMALAYLVVLGSIVAFSAYTWLLRVASTSLVSTYAFVNPVVAVILGWLILSEPISARMIFAGLVTVAGVAIIVTARTKPPEASDPMGNPGDTPPPGE